jgi:poly-gamma-glutamate synthesis protein (capsule biosynthesis protein)
VSRSRLLVVAVLAIALTACSEQPPVATPTTTTIAPDPNTYISFAFTGDVLTHTPLIEQARRTAKSKGLAAEYDFTPMFEDVKQFVKSVDMAMCHLETPIAPEGEALSAFPFFGVPKEVVTAIANAGFDRCSTASNHTYDRGLNGIDATVNALLENGVDQSGMARTPDEIEPRIVEVKGVRLCFLSYTFSYNGLKLPKGQEWRSAVINPDRILRDAERARQLGSEATIVSMHWGNEKESQANSMQTGIAEKLTASGLVDLIVGHHAHVVQPIEQVNGVWVMYGLGNVLSNLPTDERWPANSQDAAIATINLTKRPSGKISFDRPQVTPTWVDKRNGWVIRDVLTMLADPKTGYGTARELELSLGRTTRVLGEFIVPYASLP